MATFRINPNAPIPNNPFYSPTTNLIQGDTGNLIIGSGLSVDYATGTLSATGGGGGGGAVNQVIGGTGVSVSPLTGVGTVTVSNTGVTGITAGSGIVVSGSTGNITISALTAPGTVTNVSGVSPVSVTTGTTTPVISVGAASTTASGVTQLVNSLTVNDATKSLTAAQGYALQQQLSALTLATNLTLGGTFNAATGKVLTTTTDGTAAGFTVGGNLPAPVAGNTDIFTIVTTPGTYDPPGPSGPFTLNQGDWLLSDGTVWQQVSVGFQAPAANSTTAGVVRIATLAETQTGTDALIAVSASSACQTYIPRSCVTAKGTLLAGTAASSPAALPIGITGQILMVDPLCSTGMKWTNVPNTGGTVTFVGNGNGLTGGPITSSGSLDLKIQALAPGSYTNTSLTVNCYGLITSISNGPTAIPTACITGKGSLITGTGPNAPTALPAGADGYVLASCSAAANGLCWIPNTGGGGAAAGIPCSCITAKGTLIAGSGTNLPASLPVGADNLYLRACSACALGVTWAAGCAGTVTNVVGTTPISVATGTTIPVVSINTATTTSPGATQLIDNTTSNDNTKALTAAQGYSLQQQLSALLVATNLTLAGTINATTGLILSTTTDGTAAGFVAGNPLPAPAPGNQDYFVIATVAGSYDPPGAGGPYTVTQGDWFVSSGTQWNYFDVGPAIPTGTTGTPGIVQLATSAQTITGTDSTIAVTPAGAAAAYIPLNKLTGQGALAVGVATSTAGTLAVGTAGQVLTVDLSCTNGLKWATPNAGTVTSITAGAGLSGGTITSTGTLALSTSGVTAGAYTYPSITVDTYGRITAAANGSAPVLCSTVTTKGDLLAASGANTVTRLGSGTDGQILVACAACTTGLAWVAPASASGAIPCSALTSKGALITASVPGTPTALAVGTDGQVLIADSTCPSGLRWCTSTAGGGTMTSITAGAGLSGGTITTSGTISIPNSGVVAGAYTNSSITVDARGIITAASSGPAAISCSIVTTKGDLLAAAGAQSVCRLAVGSNGQILTVNSACPTGVEWAAAPAAIPCACITAKGTLISGSAPNAPTALPVGTDGQILVACSSAPTGLCWLSSGAAAASIPCSTVTGKGAIVTGTAANAPSALPVGTDGQLLVACAACSTGLAWIAPATAATAIPCACITGKGAIVTGTAANSPTALAVGTDGQLLVACSACSSGITWATSVYIPNCTLNAKGSIVTATAACIPTALSVGTDGQILAACAACASGLTWIANTVGTVTNVTGSGAISVATGTTTPAISVASATTAIPGVVQLVDNLTTNDNTKALTASMGCCLQQQLNALAVSSNITLAGTLNASTGLLDTVTTEGTSAGFTVGSTIPSPAAGNNNYYVMVTTSGSYTPPGGGGPYNTTQGDWLLSNGSQWEYLNVGYDPAVATTTTAGIVRLSTNVETQTGTSNTIAVTPASACATYIRCAALTAKGAILTASGASTPVALPVGTDNQVLVACAACSSGLTWIANPGSAAIPCSTLAAKGSLVSASGAGTPANLAVGTDGQLLVACSASATGLCWTSVGAATCAIPCSTVTAKGALVTGTAASTPSALPVGSDCQVLVACAAATTGLCWTSISTLACAIPCATVTGKGAIVTGTASSTPSALSVGSDGQVLVACAAASTGLCWTTNLGSTAIPCACITAKGAILVGTNASAPSSLAVGSDGQILVACSSSANGLCWTTNLAAAAIPCACVTGKGALITGSAAGTISPLAVGSDGQILVACSAATNGLCWIVSPSVPCSAYTTKGVILAATGTGTPTALAVGTNGQVLTANSACSSGVTWTTPATGTVTCIATGTGISGGPITSSGTIAIANTTVTAGSYTNACFTVNAQGQLTAAGSGPAPVLCCTVTTLGDLIVGSGSATVTRLGVGLNGQVLMACGLCPTGLTWVTASSAFGNATPTVAGTLKGCTENIYRNTALGCQALANSVAPDNVAVGYQAGCATAALAAGNVFVGAQAGFNNCTGCNNIAIGMCSNYTAAVNNDNIAIGKNSLQCLATGNCNIAIGSNTLCAQLLGCNNVAIGHFVQLPSCTTGCQLAIGYNNLCCWLTGCPDLSIRPGAGILDCTGSAGTAGQSLTSTGGNAVIWANPSAGGCELIYSARLCQGYGWSGGQPIPYWLADFCTTTGFSIASCLGHANSAIVMPIGRKIRIDASISIANSSGQRRDAYLCFVNAATGTYCNGVPLGVFTNPTDGALTQLFSLHGFVTTSANNCAFAWVQGGVTNNGTLTNGSRFTATIVG